jgi:predicted nuclease of predicted toxin-antitoxin system
MNLVADEGVDKAIVDALRAGGFSVEYFAEVGGGSTDKEVLAAANDAQSLLLTCDKDFGELVFRQRQVHAGVVLIRLTGMPATKKASMVLEALKKHGSDMGDAFTVISAGLLRIRHRDPRPPPT